MIATPESYFYHSDHLGNTSFMTDRSGSITQHTEYLPFGEPLLEQGSGAEGWQTSWLFNSKEYDRETGLYYYGARYYDPRLALWLSPDPLQEKYPAITSYGYTLNNPINALDPDGGLVIFVNGFFFNPLEMGNELYWRKYSWKYDKQLCRPIIDGDIQYAFDLKVMEHLSDYNAIYIDGSVGGFLVQGKNAIPKVRYLIGKTLGRFHAKEIISNLQRDENGEIVEHIKGIAHSMGCEFLKGYIQSILDYADENNITNLIIDFEADFAPFQPGFQNAVHHPNMGPTLQFSHSEDNIAGNKPINGAIMMDTSADSEQGHGIGTFIHQIKNLPTKSFEPSK